MSNLSNDKGGKFERKCCVDLSLWLSNGQRKDTLYRSAMSGGRATQALKTGDKLAAQAGDIVAVHEDGMKLTEKYVIECKHRKAMGFYNLVVHHKGQLFDFWEKLCDEVDNFNKYPLLIFKENRRPTLIGFDPVGIYGFLNRTEQDALVQCMVSLDNPMWIAKYDEVIKLKPKF